MYIDAFASDPRDSPALDPVAQPDLGEGPHLAYAVQWFIFSVCAAVGWVLAVRHSAAKRRRREPPSLDRPPAEAASAR
jgi:cytochrome oxidase assembly protein ShyY1